MTTTTEQDRPVPDELVADEQALRLLDLYGPGGSVFFASQEGVLLGRGVDATVPKLTCARADLPGRVREFLTSAREFGRANSMVMGAIPFGENLPAHLVMPTELVRSPPLNVVVPQEALTAVSGCTPREVPSGAEYERGVQRVLSRMRHGELSKAVLARSLELDTREAADARRVLRNFALANPAGHTFAVDLPARGEDGTRSGVATPHLTRTFTGSSPELLVSRRGMTVRSQPMAGSRPRGADAAEDHRLATELSTSDKDQREHAAVVEQVAGTLRPYCTDLDVPAAPKLVSTPTMWHLATEISGELADPAVSSLELATALHPTPAVCGTPVDTAREAISAAEPFDRGFYAGLVGWCDADGDGEWVIALRCADIEPEVLRLFAGAGIVLGSDPSAELAETTAKLRTALSAVGLDRQTDAPPA